MMNSKFHGKSKGKSIFKSPRGGLVLQNSRWFSTCDFRSYLPKCWQNPANKNSCRIPDFLEMISKGSFLGNSLRWIFRLIEKIMTVVNWWIQEVLIKMIYITGYLLPRWAKKPCLRQTFIWGGLAREHPLWRAPYAKVRLTQGLSQKLNVPSIEYHSAQNFMRSSADNTLNSVFQIIKMILFSFLQRLLGYFCLNSSDINSTGCVMTRESAWHLRYTRLYLWNLYFRLKPVFQTYSLTALLWSLFLEWCPSAIPELEIFSIFSCFCPQKCVSVRVYALSLDLLVQSASLH